MVSARGPATRNHGCPLIISSSQPLSSAGRAKSGGHDHQRGERNGPGDHDEATTRRQDQPQPRTARMAPIGSITRPCSRTLRRGPARSDSASARRAQRGRGLSRRPPRSRNDHHRPSSLSFAARRDGRFRPMPVRGGLGLILKRIRCATLVRYRHVRPLCHRHRAGLPRIENVLGIELPELKPRYNVAPTPDGSIVRATVARGLRAGRGTLGLNPGLVEGAAHGLCDVQRPRRDRRHETRLSGCGIRARRCLVPPAGSTNGATREGRKQPWYFSAADGQEAGVAGLWEEWHGRDAPPLLSCTILVAAANDLVAPIHDRMAVILGADDYATWLDPAQDSATVALLLRPLSVGMAAQLAGVPRRQRRTGRGDSADRARRRRRRILTLAAQRVRPGLRFPNL